MVDQRPTSDLNVSRDVKGVIGDNSGTINQYFVSQEPEIRIKERELKTGSPYLGLSKFQTKDKAKFFGRETWIRALSTYLLQENNNVLLLLGASGSGKSSLIRAGLIPHLEDHWGSFSALTFEPDVNPFESLYACLKHLSYKQSQVEVAQTVAADTLIHVAKSLKGDTRWLIFIDQFEELFTRTPETIRKPFVDGLVQLIQTYQGDRSLKIVLTMRTDFLDRLGSEPELGKIHDHHSRMLTDMNEGELRLAIQEPAAQNGVVFESGLIEEIIRDCKGDAGSLPLLQYTLNLLWENDDVNDRVLNTTTYEKLGGVTGALQTQANKIYKSLDKSQQDAVKKIFFELVGLANDEPVSRRTLKSQFLDGGTQEMVLETLIENRLLVSRGDDQQATVEVAHEALLRTWEILQQLIQDRKDIIILRDQLMLDAERWQELRKQDESSAKGDLWSGWKLDRVLALQTEQMLDGLDETVQTFIEASHRWRDEQADKDRIQAEKDRKIARRTLAGVTIFSVFMTGAALFSLLQVQQAQRQRVEQWATNAKVLSTDSRGRVSAVINAIAAKGLSQSVFVQFPDSPSFPAVDGSLLDVVPINREQNQMLHEAEVLSVAFSADGQRIVSGSSDKTVRLWDANTGAPIGQPLSGHESGVYSVAFSPDGQRIVSGSLDKTVRLWDANTGAPIGQPLRGHESGVNSVAFSADGQRIVSGSDDNTVRLWDANTGAPIGQPLSGHEDRVESVAFSADGQHIVSGSGDSTVRLWDAKTGAPIGQPLRGHEYEVFSVAFSPDSQRIVSSGRDKTVRLWDANTGAPIGQPLRGHEDAVFSVAFSADGQRIVSGSLDSTVRLWDANTGAPIGQPLSGHEDAVWSVAFSPDGQHIVSGSSDDTLRLWDANTGAPIGQPLRGHGDGVWSVAFSPDGQHIVSGSGDSTVRLWDANTGALIGQPLSGHESGVDSVAFSADGQRIVSGSSDRTVRLWDANTGAPIGQPFSGHGDGVNSVAFSPDGQRIVSGSWDGTVRLWDANTGAPIGQPLSGHEDLVNSVAFSPDGQRIVSGSRDNTVRLWDAKTGAPIGQPLSGHEDAVWSVAFSPDGQRIVSGSSDETVRLWDAKTGAPIGQPLSGHEDAVWSVAFSPDGQRIVSGSNDETVRLWDAKTCAPIGQPLSGHEYEVWSVAFSPDGQRIVSGSSDETVRLWDVTWEFWLERACNQLRYHPSLTQPTTDVAREAKKTCERYVWNR